MKKLNACPYHGFDTWLLVSYFYDGISPSMKKLLENMCGGDFLSKNPEEALDFLNYVAKASKGWDETNPREMLVEQANVVGQFKPSTNAQYDNNYNPSWRNHPNLF